MILLAYLLILFGANISHGISSFDLQIFFDSSFSFLVHNYQSPLQGTIKLGNSINFGGRSLRMKRSVYDDGESCTLSLRMGRYCVKIGPNKSLSKNRLHKQNVNSLNDCITLCQGEDTCTHFRWWKGRECLTKEFVYAYAEGYECGYCMTGGRRECETIGDHLYYQQVIETTTTAEECMEICYQRGKQCEYWNWSASTNSCDINYFTYDGTAPGAYGSITGNCLGGN